MPTPETLEKQAIKRYLALKGYYVYHNLAGLGCFAGLADLTAIKNGRVIQIEVKAGKGRQSSNQIRFQEEWESYGGVYVCGDLEAVLKVLDK